MSIRHVFLLTLLVATVPPGGCLLWVLLVDNPKGDLLTATIAVIGLLWTAGLAGILLLARYFTRPIVQMQAAAQDIARKHSGQHLAQRGPRELRQLGASINAMSDSLYRQWEDLTRSREELLYILQSLGDAIITTDANGLVTQLNPSAENLTGWSSRDALWKPWGDIAKLFGPPPLMQPKENLIREVLAKGRVDAASETGILVSRNGARCNVSITAAPLTGDKGTIIGVVLAIRDITEQSRQQAALIESESKFAQFFHLNPDGVFVVRMRDGILLDCNKAFTRITGYERSEALGKSPESSELPIWQTYDASVRNRYTSIIKENGELLGVEIQARHKDGHSVFGIMSFRQLMIAGDACVLAVFHDITEAKKVEQNLRDQAARLQVLFDESPISIWEEDFSEVRHRIEVWRLQGVSDWRGFFLQHPEEVAYCATLVKILDVNLTGARFFGATDKARISPNLQDYLREEAMPAFREELIALASGAARVEGELSTRDQKGNPCFLYFTLSVLPGHAETLDRVLITFTDVTAHRRSEQDMRDYAARLDIALRSSEMGIWELDLVTGKRFFDKQTCHLLGIDHDAFQGTPDEFYNIVHGDDREHMRAALRSAIETGEPYDQEFRVVHPDGAVRYLKARGHLLNINGEKPKKFIGMIWDNTARRQAEINLRQAQKMEAIGQLAGGVAHDFNNIITATMMNLTLLQQEANLTPSMRATLEELAVESKRATALSRQLLMFSRRESASMHPVNLNETLSSLIKMIQRLLTENIRLNFAQSDRSFWANADSGMIEQAVMNLCLNARDAMPRGGELSVSIDRIHIGPDALARHPEARSGDFIAIEVHDTGSGMSPATIQHIFEPYFTTKAPGKGTGLGLSIVYGIVHQHGGWIELESTLGQGSVFRLLFPVLDDATAAQAESEAGNTATPSGGYETILLAEDESLVRRASAMFLRSIGYTVYDAADGTEALELWESHRHEIDLLLTDLVMPGDITGVDLCERVRQEKPGLKVIITSGYRADLSPEDLLSQPGVVFLAKPCTATTLAHTVREHLDAQG